MSDAFDSTDEQRDARPLRYLQQVTFPESMQLELGGELPSVVCAYETFGRLNAKKSNAVLICHAISGDSHVTRHDPADAPGWWESLVGPGQAIDTDQYYVICPNMLGGCRGSTGPGSIDPATGRRYGKDFPQITVTDMVDVQAMLADHLGIETFAAVVGGSLGGHLALVWATRYPQRVATCCAIATSPRMTAQSLAFDVIGRNAIQSDPHFNDGQYYGRSRQPDVGLAIARMLGHITYLSSEAMADKFDIDRHHPREIDTQFEKKFSVGSYLAYQGDKFTERFDANSYITLSLAMDLMDFGTSRAQLVDSFAAATCRWLVVSFSSDWLFPPNQSREIVAALTAQNRQVTYAEITTNAGHDAFLMASDVAKYGPLISAALDPPGPRPGDDPPPRLDDQRILEMIEPGDSVLDLGCGDGHLLAALRARGHGRLCGVEVKQASITATAKRGLPVLDYDLNQSLHGFADDSYDVVVLSATLPAIENLENLFDEMFRIGKRCVLSFANFGFRDLRRMFTEQGRAPKMEGEYKYDWFNTPNCRFPSIADVEDLLTIKQATVHKAIYLDTLAGKQIAPEDDPNLNADTAILVFSRK
jgi:homoserine O-acetyltransferase/O-succinyltransferase